MQTHQTTSPFLLEKSEPPLYGKISKTQTPFIKGGGFFQLWQDSKRGLCQKGGASNRKTSLIYLPNRCQFWTQDIQRKQINPIFYEKSQPPLLATF